MWASPTEGLRAEAERLLATDPALAAITDAEEIMAEAERLLARGDPDVLAALAQARRGERSAGES